MNFIKQNKINEELFYRVCNGNAKGVEESIKSGADINCRDDLARKTGEIKKNKFVYYKNIYSPYVMEKCGRTALAIAVLREKEKIVKVLIDNGADVNRGTLKGFKYTYDKDIPVSGVTPLMDVKYIKSDPVKFAKILINSGSNIESKNSLGETVFFIVATQYDTNLDLFKFLIKCGADINTENKNGQSVIEILYTEIFIEKEYNENKYEESQKLQLLEYLINNGADVQKLNISKEEFLNLIKVKKTNNSNR